jgi:SAM-dependent methyltransferase
MGVTSVDRAGVTRCYLCGGRSLRLLPQLPGRHSVTTDGQFLNAPLQKYQCPDCALVQSDPATVLNAATFSYEATYDFYAKPLMRAFERKRYQNYANWAASFLDGRRSQRVLEIGCGAGWVLELLREAHPSISFQGLEPSAGATRRANEAGLDVREGNVDSHPFHQERFDFLYCINVLEHVADPISFLRRVSGLLQPGGAALVICPCANVIDPELLFADHLYSYTRENLQRLVVLSGLVPALWQQGPGMLYPFQALCAGKAPLEISSSSNGLVSWRTDVTLPSAQRDYFRRWTGLDDTLLRRLGPASEVVCFGAGETTDLLRAHAPRCWQAIRAYMIDRPDGAELGASLPLVEGLRVRFTHDYRGDEFDAILLGVKPRYQTAISERLQIFGKPVVRWDDLIPEPFV